MSIAPLSVLVCPRWGKISTSGSTLDTFLHDRSVRIAVARQPLDLSRTASCCTCRSNYRTLILGLTYGYCFGVELTIDNNIASYFSDQFGKGIKAAGNFGAIFGLFNILSRPVGARWSAMDPVSLQ